MKFPRLKGLQKNLKDRKKPKEAYNSSPVDITLRVAEDPDEAPRVPDDLPPNINVQYEKTPRSSDEPVFQSLNGSANREAFKFSPNSKYTTVLVYAIIFVIVAAIVFTGFIKGSFSGGIRKFFSAISPFIVGLFVALVFERPISWLEKNLWSRLFKKKERPGLKRILSIVITYLVVIGLVFILFRFVIPQLIMSIQELLKQSDSMVEALLGFMSAIEERVPGLELGDIEKAIRDQSQGIIGYLSSSVMPKLLEFGISTAKTIFNIIISIIVSIYILYDKRRLSITGLRTVYSLLSISKANRFAATVTECTDIFTDFVFGKTLDSLIIGMLSFVVLSIAGFKFSVLVSVIIGVTNMIPYFGPFIGAVPGAIIYLCFSPKQMLIFLIIVLVIQQLDGLIIGPKILGDSTGLSPLWVIIGTTVGGAYGGVLGMFLGVPVTAVISYLAGRLFDFVLKKKQIDIS